MSSKLGEKRKLVCKISPDNIYEGRESQKEKKRERERERER